jgi:two-component system cell cycle response regulator
MGERESGKMARVVVIDGDEGVRSSIRATLQADGCEVVAVGDGAGGLAAARSAEPDLILLDLGLPDVDGYDLLRALREEGREVEAPVVLLSAQDDLMAKVKGLESGAVEYLVKPVHPKELSARVRALLRVQKAQEVLRRQYLQAAELSLVDELTRAYNRRFMDKAMREKVALALRHGYTFSCAMFDIDRFKGINDTYGHAFGDFVLREVAGRAMKVIRKEDAVVRYGGDEFVVLLAQAGHYGARRFAERLRRRIGEAPFEDGAHRVGVTINVGVATFPEDAGIASAEELLRMADVRLYEDRTALERLSGRLAEELLRAADTRMYAAKNSGGDRVVAE